MTTAASAPSSRSPRSWAAPSIPSQGPCCPASGCTRARCRSSAASCTSSPPGRVSTSTSRAAPRTQCPQKHLPTRTTRRRRRRRKRTLSGRGRRKRRRRRRAATVPTTLAWAAPRPAAAAACAKGTTSLRQDSSSCRADLLWTGQDRPGWAGPGQARHGAHLEGGGAAPLDLSSSPRKCSVARSFLCAICLISGLDLLGFLTFKKLSFQTGSNVAACPEVSAQGWGHRPRVPALGDLGQPRQGGQQSPLSRYEAFRKGRGCNSGPWLQSPVLQREELSAFLGSGLKAAPLSGAGGWVSVSVHLSWAEQAALAPPGRHPTPCPWGNLQASPEKLPLRPLLHIPGHFCPGTAGRPQEGRQSLGM